MKAYRKKRMKEDTTPFVPTDRVVYVMDSLNPSKKMKAEIVSTRIKAQREVIDTLACPVCNNPMSWDACWEAFICTKHGQKAIYELVKQQ